MITIEFDSPAGHKVNVFTSIDLAKGALASCKRNGFTNVTVNGTPVEL